MFVALIVTSLHDLARMGLVFLDSSIGQETDIIVYVEVEQWARFPTSLVHDEIVECVVLGD